MSANEEHAQRLATCADWVKSTLDHVHVEWSEMKGIVRGLLGTQFNVDEMSLLFHDEEVLATFVRAAVAQEGYTLFNSAYDTVQTRPLRSEYHVRYWFLSTPHDYRLELMTAYRGSPLHDRMMASFPGGAVGVHASFKCPTEEAYAQANAALYRNGYEPVQFCLSSYGKFGYWMQEESEGMPDWFLKPRVNLRDAQ